MGLSSQATPWPATWGSDNAYGDPARRPAGHSLSGALGPAGRRARAGIRFGDEGQGWALMPPETYCGHAEAIPQFARQIRLYLAGDDLERTA